MSGSPTIAPARIVLEKAASLTESTGHENHGSLSYHRGFLPTKPMPHSLPPKWTAWENLVADLPRHYRDLTLREAAAKMPLIDAEDLPDEFLQRATALLGTLAHAVWYVESASPEEIPACITTPWEQVRKRLGRPDAVISYIELIIANWKMANENAVDPFDLKNLSLSIATVDNPEEHRFYLLQTRVLSVSAPFIGLTVRAQDAVLANDQVALMQVFQDMRAPLRALAGALRHLDPRPNHKSYMHPVSWAKTVAEFAVPTAPGMHGPSGTSSPVFPLLDGLLGRKSHRSYLGQEMKQLCMGYPVLWRELLATLVALPIDEYVAQSGSADLQKAYQDLRDGYAGPTGFLGKHRRKVQGYIEIAFKMGKAKTVGGFKGAFTARAWDKIDDEIEASRKERLARVKDVPETVFAPLERAIPFSEVTTHCGPDSAWCIIRGVVYDLTDFLATHPGGDGILRLHIGRDCTHGYNRSHGGFYESKAVFRMLQKYRIGVAFVPEFADEKLAALYSTWRGALDLLTEMRTAIVLDHSLQDLAVTSAHADARIGDDSSFRSRGAHPASTWQLQRGIESHLRFLQTYVKPVLGEVLPKIDSLLAACGNDTPVPEIEVPQEWVMFLDSLLSAGPELDRWRDAIPEILRRDQMLIDALADIVRIGLKELEGSADEADVETLAATMKAVRDTAVKYMASVGSLRADNVHEMRKLRMYTSEVDTTPDSSVDSDASVEHDSTVISRVQHELSKLGNW